MSFDLIEFLKDAWWPFTGPVGGPLFFVWKRQEGNRRAISDLQRDAAVQRNQIENNAKAIEEAKRHHETTLGDFRGDIKGIEAKLEEIRRDFSKGFENVSQRIFELLSQSDK